MSPDRWQLCRAEEALKLAPLRDEFHPSMRR